MRDRNNPNFYATIESDPHLQLNKKDRQHYIADLKRPLARVLLPVVRFSMLLGIHIVRTLKRYLPIRIRAHGLLNKMGVWFMRDLISPEALYYIIQHFQLESSLINFVADNCQSDEVKRVSLIPTNVSQLGDVGGMNAIVLHDINMYNLIIDTGSNGVNVFDQLDVEKINFSALDLPEIEHQPLRKRLINFDTETAAYIMVFFLVLFLDDKEGERAALSLQLDESLMQTLANLTGDDYYLRLCPMKYTHYQRYHFDVVQDLRFHMMSVDQAYHRLKQMQSRIHVGKS